MTTILPFTSPVNGASGIDANIVRGNDNVLGQAINDIVDGVIPIHVTPLAWPLGIGETEIASTMVLVGSATAPTTTTGTVILANGTTISTGNVRGLVVAPMFGTASSAGMAIQSKPAIAAGATVSICASFNSADPIVGAGASIPLNIGFRCVSLTAGTLNYAFYSEGTTPSLFGGAVTIGGATNFPALTNATLGGALFFGGSGTNNTIFSGGAGGFNITNQANTLVLATVADAGGLTIPLGGVAVTGNSTIAGTFGVTGTFAVGTTTSINPAVGQIHLENDNNTKAWAIGASGALHSTDFIFYDVSVGATRGSINTTGVLTWVSDVTIGGVVTTPFTTLRSTVGQIVLSNNTATKRWTLGATAAGGTDFIFYDETASAQRGFINTTGQFTWSEDVSLAGSGKKFGALGATPVVRPTVSGSKTPPWGGGLPALSSLLAALAALGLITDSTTA